MKIIVLASQKGGAGKTTLCGHLSVEASLNGHKVAIIDTDPQGSLAAWWNGRESDSPAFVSSSIIKLQDDINLIKKEGFDYLFIDTPPAVTETIETVVGVADLVVIPTRPSPHDLRAVGKTVDIVNDCNKRMVFVINGAANRARISADAAIALSQHGAVCPTVVYQRTDFASSMIDGRTVQEMDKASKSAIEVRELWKYVNTHLRNGKIRP
ncbi:MAG: chromosome partitioning protein ParA [Polynucleobacter sp. 24-46-87]|jgi:chromosome partitioning protein|uniref:ParA family protein n=1 Tax=Hydrogenophaga sp. TaxID=1904254 RepID=UPI000BD38DEB|nr:ParA family protein [Hydrogenophaga sp.]MDP1959001.1 ParA family protein [Methylotenera sp.]MDP3885441.1 ParA family protein [Hydrogenophaga sp.]OZA11553.1 MAG: chromosome partitioning protein ParA [Polynucleobacter sp. 24-46-87]